MSRGAAEHAEENEQYFRTRVGIKQFREGCNPSFTGSYFFMYFQFRGLPSANHSNVVARRR
jgi:hypothetical protein